MQNTPITTSAKAKFAMNRLVTVCIDFVVDIIQITSEFPRTANKLMVP